MSIHFNVVLVEPEIPQNTGNIGRLCLATGSSLHLVEPLGFELSDSQLKRAGLDYWPHLDVHIHPNLPALMKSIPSNAQKVFFTKKAGKTHFEHRFESGAYLFFGKETRGLSDELINQWPQHCVRLPMFDARVRSLNLANAVGISVYEAIRQCHPDFEALQSP